MQRIRTLGLALVAVLALSAIAVSSASASSFLAHPTGAISGSNTNIHKFKTEAGIVECETATIAGNAAVLKSLHQLVRVTYTNCTAFSLFTVHISPALYLFSADLKVSVENDIILTVLAIGSCQILVGPAGNQNLDSVHYGNEAGGKLRVNALVKGITYTSNGGSCGTAGVHNDGTYFGEATVSGPAGGVLRWDKE